ncbi:hypothetical protein JCM8795_16510 [Hydrogenobaculum acidophilum]
MISGDGLSATNIFTNIFTSVFTNTHTNLYTKGAQKILCVCHQKKKKKKKKKKYKTSPSTLKKTLYENIPPMKR